MFYTVGKVWSKFYLFLKFCSYSTFVESLEEILVKEEHSSPWYCIVGLSSKGRIISERKKTLLVKNFYNNTLEIFYQQRIHCLDPFYQHYLWVGGVIYHTSSLGEECLVRETKLVGAEQVAKSISRVSLTSLSPLPAWNSGTRRADRARAGPTDWRSMLDRRIASTWERRLQAISLYCPTVWYRKHCNHDVCSVHHFEMQLLKKVTKGQFHYVSISTGLKLRGIFYGKLHLWPFASSHRWWHGDVNDIPWHALLKPAPVWFPGCWHGWAGRQ